MRLLALLTTLLLGCGSRDHASSPPPPVVPTPPPPPAAPPPPRPPDSPCAMNASVGGDVFDRFEYQYGGPATCTVPFELQLPGCPTTMHDTSPRAPEREALYTFTYAPDGKLQHWTATSPSTGEVMED